MAQPQRNDLLTRTGQGAGQNPFAALSGGDSPFLEQLQIKTQLDPRMQPRPKPTGFEDNAAGALYLVDQFAQGATEGRVQKYAMDEVTKQQQWNTLVSSMAEKLNDPDLTQEGRDYINAEIMRLSQSRLAQETKGVKDKGPGGAITGFLKAMLLGEGATPPPSKPVDVGAEFLRMTGTLKSRPEFSKGTAIATAGQEFNKIADRMIKEAKGDVTQVNPVAFSMAINPIIDEVIRVAPDRAQGFLALRMQGFNFPQNVTEELTNWAISPARTRGLPFRGMMPTGTVTTGTAEVSPGGVGTPPPPTTGTAPPAPPPESGGTVGGINPGALAGRVIAKMFPSTTKPIQVRNPDEPTDIRQVNRDEQTGRLYDIQTGQDVTNSYVSWSTTRENEPPVQIREGKPSAGAPPELIAVDPRTGKSINVQMPGGGKAYGTEFVVQTSLGYLTVSDAIAKKAMPIVAPTQGVALERWKIEKEGNVLAGQAILASPKGSISDRKTWVASQVNVDPQVIAHADKVLGRVPAGEVKMDILEKYMHGRNPYESAPPAAPSPAPSPGQKPAAGAKPKARVKILTTP